MWSMPRNVLRWVAGILAACALTGLVLGVRNAPDKARLPGEAASGVGAAALQADEAMPLGEEPPAPPPAPVPAKVAEAKPAETADAAEAAPAAPAKPPAVTSGAPAESQEDHLGDLIDGLTPTEEPPH